MYSGYFTDSIRAQLKGTVYVHYVYLKTTNGYMTSTRACHIV